ncbi:MAG: DEAD/DEAH box helicase [Prevotella sp.]|nr:DEAD/DEAH box helicase [Prevotella sp.]
MDDKSLFLQHFTRNKAISISSKSKRPDSIFFMICFNEQGLAFLKVVDKNGEEVETEYRLYTDNNFNVLRSMARAKEDMQEKITWGTEQKRVYLHEYRWLLYELMRCDNIVDEKMHKVSVSEETLQVRLVIEKAGNGQCSTHVDVVGESSDLQQFMFLSDSHVLTSNTIHPIHPIGDNFSSLKFFLIQFPEAWLESFLSVFYSYMEHIVPVMDDYKLVVSEQPISTVPTIIFEKVDEDMSLYLRLVQGVEGLDYDFVQRFDLVYVARLTMEHQILLQRITHHDNLEQIKALNKKILSFATPKGKKEIYQEGDLFIIPEETAGPFLVGSLPDLVREYRLVGSDKLIKYKVRTAMPKLKMSIGSGIDFLEGAASITIDDEEFSLKKFLTQYKKNKYITLADGNRAIVDEGYMRRLERIYKHGAKKDGTLRISFFDLPEVEELMHQRMEGAAFEHHREVFEGFNRLKEQKMKFPQVNATLRNYQADGVKWINYLHEQSLGGCLADDMGLGKTLQTIAMLTRIYPKTKTPSIIVMPRTLLFNWQDELKKFAPQLTFSIYYGNQRNLDEALKSQLVLTTYALVRNDIEALCKKKFHYIILDESQNIKNVGSQTTQAVMLLQGKHRLALSGTPIENNLTELYSLFRFLNPAMFGQLEDFNREYTYPIQQQGDKVVMTALRRKIYPFLLRRLKKDVLKELPDRTEQMLFCEMSAEQQRFYEERRRYYQGIVRSEIHDKGIAKSQFVMFQALSELRRIASVPESLSDGQVASPKIDLLMENVLDAVGNGHKVVVFFNFIAGIEIVSERLDHEGIYFVTMTGSTRDRRTVVERFQNDPSCYVMLMTLKTGGVGLNLTVADTVFIFEPWWNKAAEEQAINRLHRIGQKQKVMSYSIITRDTIEEKIQLLQQQKAELFNGLIGSDSSSTKVLTEEDIEFILS